MVDDRNLHNKVMNALQTNVYKVTEESKSSPDRSDLREHHRGIYAEEVGPRLCSPKATGLLEGNVPQYPPVFVQQIAVKLMQRTTITSAADFPARTQEYQEADDEA